MSTVSTRARAVVAPREPGPLKVEEILLPQPGPHQVLVEQTASGICHTQLHELLAPRAAPTLLGHESSGVVVATGEKVSHVAAGDRVMVTWLPRNSGAAGRAPEGAQVTLADGSPVAYQALFTWAEHTLVDEQFVVGLPAEAAGMPLDLASILGCAVMTGAGAVWRTAAVGRGESVAIFGAGGIGLCAVMAARVLGAEPIIVVDLIASKLDLARRLGATHVVDAGEEDAVEAIHRMTRRSDAWRIDRQPVSGVDHAFDCVGTGATLKQALSVVRSGAFGSGPGGTAVLVAALETTFGLNAVELLLSEKRVVGCLGGSCSPERDLPTLLDWYRQRALDLDALITDRFTLDQIGEATAALRAGEIRGRAILELG